MGNITIRKAVAGDEQRLAELDAICFSEPWSLESFTYEMNENPAALYLVACFEDVIVGYAGLWLIVGEGHITNVAVHPDFRRMGIASALLEVLFKVTDQVDVHDFTLEVRAGNLGAQQLYSGFGFEEAGRRKEYYLDNKEDAIIMWKHDSVKILAIESSCDETSVAVVENGRKILSNVISSQIAIHKLYGGVVPEIASRHHLTNINAVVQQSLDEAGVTLEEVDAIAVTCGPGLVGALVIGIATAKAMAFATGKPLIAVHHIQGHISANFLEHQELMPPFMALVVSGGHTNIVEVTDYNRCRVLGGTRDDAVGEAYDKVARVLGLGYPGGPLMDKLAAFGDRNAIEFKRVFLENGSLDFSFSGIKTAVLNYVHNEKQKGNIISAEGFEGDFDSQREELKRAADVAAGFQEAVLDVIVTKATDAAIDLGKDRLVVAGGVASNSRLREKLKETCEAKGLKLYFPSPILCTDNAAMIGAAAYYKYKEGDFATEDLDAYPGLALE